MIRGRVIGAFLLAMLVVTLVLLAQMPAPAQQQVTGGGFSEPVFVSSGTIFNKGVALPTLVFADGTSQTTAASGASGFTVGLGPEGGVAVLSSTTNAAFYTLANSGVAALAFDATTAESISWTFYMPAAYDSASNLSIELRWIGEGAGTNNVVWGVQFATLTGEDLDTTAILSMTDTEQTATTASPATEGNSTTTTFTLANGDADAVAAGARCVLVLQRRAADSADNFASDAALVGVRIYQ